MKTGYLTGWFSKGSEFNGSVVFLTLLVIHTTSVSVWLSEVVIGGGDGKNG